MPNKAKVLLIEDDEDDYFFVNHLIQKNSYIKAKLTWNSNLEEATKTLENNEFDIILVDYYLGKKTALDFLNSYGKTSNTPIIVLTGLTDRSKDIEVMNNGAADYLPKETLTAGILDRSFRYTIEHKKTQEHLNRIREKASKQEKIATTGKMARSIAHEIRNPLTNINLSIAEVANLSTNKDQEPFIDIINRNVQKINTIVTDFINSTKPLELKLQKLCVNDIIKEAIESCKDSISLNNISLELELKADKQIELDNKQLPLVFTNLIKNAIEALKDTSNPKICIDSINIQNGVKVIFQDNGCGMDENTKNKLFNSFFTQKKEGLGIGMSTIQNIVFAHNGHITVNSKVNVGTKFSIYFE